MNVALDPGKPLKDYCCSLPGFQSNKPTNDIDFKDLYFCLHCFSLHFLRLVCPEKRIIKVSV